MRSCGVGTIDRASQGVKPVIFAGRNIGRGQDAMPGSLWQETCVHVRSHWVDTASRHTVAQHQQSWQSCPVALGAEVGDIRNADAIVSLPVIGPSPCQRGIVNMAPGCHALPAFSGSCVSCCGTARSEVFQKRSSLTVFTETGMGFNHQAANPKRRKIRQNRNKLRAPSRPCPT